MLRFNMKEHPFLLQPSQLHRRNESEHLNPNCRAVAGNHFLRHALHHSESMIPLHQGNHCESVPGTDSKLESLTGGCKGMHFQSSAISSSRTSYNDQRLVGSQENGVLSVTASAKLLEENMKFHSRNSSMSGEDTRTRRNENLPAAAETSVRSHPRLDISGKKSGHGRKRKRLLDAVESIGFLYSEDKRLHSQIEEKLSFLHGLVQKKIDEPIKEGKSVVPNLLGSSHAKCDKAYKRMKTSHEKEVNMQYSCDRDLSKNMEIIACEDPNIFSQECHPANSLLGTEQACIGGICDLVPCSLEDSLDFMKAACGDYMKLLDLDNAADEECYKKAMEIPLSPTLPEIGFQDIDTSIDDNEPVEKTNNHGILSSCTKISSNNSKCNVSEAPHFSSLHKAETAPGFFDIQSESHIQYSGRKMGMPSIPGSVDEGLAIPFQGELGCRCDSSIPTNFVLFSPSKAKCSNSRIFCAAKTCVDRCSLVARSEWALADILVAMKMEASLSIQEKVCVFFSLLQLHFSSVASQNSGNFLGGNFIPLIDSFAQCIRAAISDAESRSIFAEILDMLLILIEDFLLDGMVIIPDTSSEPLLCPDSRINVSLDCVNIVFTERVASADQLVAGSIILASVCVAADCTPHLAEVAYNILRTHKYDIFELLTIIHVFAFLGGQKFFTLKRLSMTMTVLKSIVTSMENRNLAVSKTSLLATCTVRPEFHPNSICPYSDGAVSEDVAISLLLETLHQYALSGINNEDVINSSASSLLLQLDNNEDSLRHKDACSVLDGSCEASCSLNKCAIQATQSESGEGVNLCQFSDILSLVELLADNMSWEWTCTKAVDPLLEMLELPVSGNLPVAIVILLGHLGRLGVDACGYEDKGVENLRSKLSAFLLRDTTIRAGLPTQIATVSALLRLIPLDYKKLIEGTVEDTSSLSVPIGFIKKWFYLLSEEQKAFSFSLLQSDSVVTKPKF